MQNNTLIWIIVAAIVAIVVIAALAMVARRSRNHKKAEQIREEVDTHAAKVDRREALADETAAKARAAEAEAEAKAAEAARLKEQAAIHHDAVGTSRHEIEERRQYADELDPKTRSDVEADDHKDEAKKDSPQRSSSTEQYERRQ